MERPEHIFRILADKNRLRILMLLRKKKMCVCEFAHILGITQPSVSRHLKKLKNAGLIKEEQDSFWTNYYLCGLGRSPAGKLVKDLNQWLKSDSVVRGDMRKAGAIDRKKICRP